jgi:hypothetical protein
MGEILANVWTRLVRGAAIAIEEDAAGFFSTLENNSLVRAFFRVITQKLRGLQTEKLR